MGPMANEIYTWGRRTQLNNNILYILRCKKGRKSLTGTGSYYTSADFDHDHDESVSLTTTGHMLVAPRRHVPDLSALTDEEMTELLAKVRDTMDIMRQDAGTRTVST